VFHFTTVFKLLLLFLVTSKLLQSGGYTMIELVCRSVCLCNITTKVINRFH